MKKLIVCAALAMAAAVSQGATMKWASGGIGLPPDGSGSATAAKVATQLFVLDATAYGQLETAVAGKSAADVSTYIYDNYKSASGAITAGTWNKGAVTQTDTASYDAGDTAYAVLLYTSTGTDGKDYYIGNYGSWEFSSAVNKTVGNMGLKLNGSGAAMSWQTASVPEPTSGLLMLIGMAGLALRRKRA